MQKIKQHQPIITIILLTLSIGILTQLHLSRFFINEKSTDLNNSEVLGASSQSEFNTQSLYSLINAHRKAHSLSELSSHPALEVSANIKILDMLKHNYFDHNDPNQRPSWYFFKQVGYDYKLAGENLAFNVNTPWQVLQAWMDSPAHNQELLNPAYNDMGISADCQRTASSTQNCVIVLHLGSK